MLEFIIQHAMKKSGEWPKQVIFFSKDKETSFWVSDVMSVTPEEVQMCLTLRHVFIDRHQL